MEPIGIKPNVSLYTDPTGVGRIRHGALIQDPAQVMLAVSANTSLSKYALSL